MGKPIREITWSRKSCGTVPSRKTPVPEFIDPVFAKISPKSSLSTNENERFGLILAKTGSLNSDTGKLGSKCGLLCQDFSHSLKLLALMFPMNIAQYRAKKNKTPPSYKISPFSVFLSSRVDSFTCKPPSPPPLLGGRNFMILVKKKKHDY